MGRVNRHKCTDDGIRSRPFLPRSFALCLCKGIRAFRVHGVHKDIYSSVTVKCTQEFVLVTFHRTARKKQTKHYSQPCVKVIKLTSTL